MVEKNINESILKKDPLANNLIQHILEIDEKNQLDGVCLYHQFPFYRDITGENLLRANILFASKNNGIIIFQCIDANRNPHIDIEKEIFDLNAIDSLVFSKLINSEILKKERRELKITITPALYFGENAVIKQTIPSGIILITRISELEEIILTYNNNAPLDQLEFLELKALLEGSKVIPKKNERKLKTGVGNINSKGSILSVIEHQIATFDQEQKKAALFTLDSPQRIRGLAGSGKTIILAMKAALIHIQDPSAEILYTYYTKALNDYVKKLITRFYRQFASKDPNWDKIHIIHAWGGRRLEGVYYNACKNNSVPPLTFGDARFKSSTDPFAYVCEELIKNDLKKQYDYSLLDEAQDFPKAFYQLCRMLTEKDRVIWAYDDFQNILDVKLQNEKETFGKDKQGNYYIDFSKSDDELQDLILHKCYRNPRKNLLVAFALGLGIYNDNKRVLQRLENNAHWVSLGFTVEKGNSKENDEMVISRPPENSPLIKNELLENDIFKIIAFKSFSEECKSVADSIILDIKNELLPEDIAVISLDGKNQKEYFDNISELLEANNIKTFSLLDAPADNRTYRVQDHVTMSSIFRAKGNESGSVYIVGVDAIFKNKDSIIERNKLFTAITRSEAWVTITGVGELVEKCIGEYTLLEKNDFKLVFKQPSEESTKTIYREMSKRQEKLNLLEKIADDLKNLGLSEEELKAALLNLVQKKK